MTTQHGSINYQAEHRTLVLSGDWDLASLPAIQFALDSIDWPPSGNIIFDGRNISKIDSAGAWLIAQTIKKLAALGLSVERHEFPPAVTKLLDIINTELSHAAPLPTPKKQNPLEKVGRNTAQQLAEFKSYLTFIGKLTFEYLRLLPHPSRWRFNAMLNILYSAGYQGLPIIALLSFLIGVVLTYQMGLQLKTYGANIYIVDLLGLSILREFAPLITAIMVSGRTGSAFTASIGMMKLNQEVDALDTIGVTPGELLILPRIIALFIALPLLTMWSVIFGIIGGLVMSNSMLGITWYDFLHRFPQVVPLKTLLLGLGKTPVFALIISSIGCYQGMQVKNSAESVGTNTTRSVVLAIFFIIVADALFSIVFSKLKL